MGIKRINEYLLAFYDELGCYDEIRISPLQLRDIEFALNAITRAPSEDGEYSRLFILYKDGTWDEIKLEKYK